MTTVYVCKYKACAVLTYQGHADGLSLCPACRCLGDVS